MCSRTGVSNRPGDSYPAAERHANVLCKADCCWSSAATNVSNSKQRYFMIRRLNGKPRPELDIDLYHGHPSPETRIWDRRSGPVVDGSGPMQDLPLGA